MSKTFGQSAAELLAAINNADTNQLVEYRTTSKDIDIITITIPEKLENSSDFNKTFVDLEQFPSRLFSSSKVKRKRVKNWNSYIVYIDKQGLSTYTKEELSTLLNSLDQNSVKVEDVAPFIYNLSKTWLESETNLRKHRSITPDMVRGYIKQRQNYTHRELLDMVLTYIKWAQAFQRAVDDTGDDKPFWFPRVNFQALLLTNKIFANHLEGGWKQLVQDKRIPAEYTGEVEESVYSKLSPDAELSDEEKHDKRILYWANDMMQHGEHVIQPDILEKYGDEIRAKVKELQNAA